jgi:phage shock protein A
MGFIGKIKGAFSSKANAALDRAIDPAKELEMKIFELEEGKKKALQELVSYRATAKTMEQDIARHAERIKKFEERAMIAVRAGDDDLARRCLKEKKDAETELAKVTRDRDEIASHAIQLNNSRKVLETKLQILKLKKGTLATQIAAARSGGSSPLGIDDALFDKLAAAEDKIDGEAALAEVDAELGGPAGGSLGGGGAELEQKLLAAEASHGGADALSELKARMQADQDRKKLK